MFVESYIQNASAIFAGYSLQSPLPDYLKKYFKANPKFGSRDRKFIAELLYGIYRLGPQNNDLSIREKLLIGSFLSGSLPLLFFEKTDRFLAENYQLTFSEKKKLIIEKYGVSFHIKHILSQNISEDEYIEYLFQPSRVFIRIRKNSDQIISSLQHREIGFTKVSDSCISFPGSTKLTEVLPGTDEYVVQDYASQMTGEYLNASEGESWWDCCAASGGKSLILLDKNSTADLTVSDIRSGIIENLHQRFRLYGHKKYKAFVIDVAKKIKQNFLFSNIIADVPCSGAGTWRRSPEQYYFFDEEKLHSYQSQQKSILHNVLLHLKSGGHLYYFTCSIFAAENEEVVNSLDESEYILVQHKLLNAFQYGGDCLFVCDIQKK